MDKDILKQNKLPGCDQFTRPEEIKTLSKYLGNIRKVQEEHTNLEVDNLEIPGRKTGKLPEINSLSDYSDELNTKEYAITNLDKDLIKSDLDNKVTNLGSSEIIDLGESENLEWLDPNISGNELYDGVIIRNSGKSKSNGVELDEELVTSKLPEFIDNLEDEKEAQLSNTVLNIIDDSIIENLEKNNLNLSISHTDLDELDLDKIKLIDDTKALYKLPEFIDNLEDEKEAQLSNTVLNIIDDSIIENLEKNNLNISISPTDLDELELDKIKLIDDTKTLYELPEFIDNLEDSTKTKLSNTVLNIIDERNLKILDNFNIKLSNTPTNDSLEKSKLDLVIKDEEVNLSDYLDELKKESDEINLTQEKENLYVSDLGNILSEKYIPIIDSQLNIQLSNEIKELEIDFSDIKLSETLLNISSEDEELLELNNYLDSLYLKEENTELVSTRIDISDDNQTSELDNTAVKLNDLTKDTQLSDLLINIEVPRDLNNLSDELINLHNASFQETNLKSKLIDLGESGNLEWLDPNISGNELYDGVIIRPDSEYNTEGDLKEDLIYLDENYTEDSTIIFEKTSKDVVTLENENLDSTEIFEESNKDIITLEDENLDSTEIFEESRDSLLNLSTNSTIDATSLAFLKSLEGDELYYKVLELAGGKSSWEQKIQSLMSAYLSSSKISPERAKEYESKLDETRKILEVTSNIKLYEDEYTLKSTEYKLPEFNLGMLNASQYLRWVAENTIGPSIHGGARELLLNETLALLVLYREKLEKSSRSNRDRLPGYDGGLVGDVISSGVSGAIGKAAGRFINAVTGANKVDMSLPINHPEKIKERIKEGENKGIIGWTAANDRVTVKSAGKSGNSNKDLLGNIKKKAEEAVSGDNKVNYKFAPNYITGEGIKTTLEELCGKTDEDVKSVDDFFTILRTSPYITTPEKFTSTKNGGYQAQTLDSNSFWEIIFEPYVGVENGSYSFLPALHEINTLNAIFHGAETSYNKWIPFTSFDLQKTKLSTKSLGLFDGEIAYPVSAEYLNEFRVTIVDDQYKSWKTYFERCMEVAVYNSEPHTSEFYKEDGKIISTKLGGKGELEAKITAIDKTHQVISMYKNITFRCVIYVMTPQKSTIRKFDLLLVLKDFTEEYSGDIDSGGTDLTVTFSIVGENPKDKPSKVTELILTPDDNWEKKSKRTDYSSMANKAVNSVMKIL